MIGKALGAYRILSHLGTGGMGEVYSAEDSRLDRVVALKVLPTEIAGDVERRARFEREAKALAALNHPNIVTIYSLEEADGTYFITMEMVNGRTLADLILEGGLPLSRYFALAVPLADAVSAAHERNIIHRDLKPRNVMVNEDGRLKVLDFGLAKLRELIPSDAASADVTSTFGTGSQVLGTLPYMSPEQAQGQPVDRTTDIFSLGVMLYEMATGERPFRGDNAAELVSSILRDSPRDVVEVNSRLPRQLGRIIGHCLEKSRERRFQTALDVRNELETLQREINSAPSRPPVQDVSTLSPPAVTSLAVLPFNNISADLQNEYFSDGVTEEIISKLARIKTLRVAARTSVARFKGTTKDAKEIGEELGVQYLLEGSVRKAGERVRITAQLIEATSGFHAWAEDYEGELNDVFRIQEQTALQIAEALNLQLTPQEQSAVRHRHTDNAQAYDAYLRGQALIHDFADPRKLGAARRHFERALELDSQYAPALAGLASVETLTYRNLDADESRLDRAAQLAKKALALSPRLCRANVAVGETLAARYDYAGAAQMFREALRVEPDDPWTWDVLSWVLGYQRPPDAQGAEHAAREALRLEPQFSHAYYHLGRALLLQQRVDEATEAFEHILELSPDAAIAHFGLAQAYLSRGQFDLALAESMKGGTSGGAVGHFQRCSIHAAQGNKEGALAELEFALEQGFRDFTAIDTDPHLESLRSEPRLQQLVRRYCGSAPRSEPH